MIAAFAGEKPNKYFNIKFKPFIVTTIIKFKESLCKYSL